MVARAEGEALLESRDVRGLPPVPRGAWLGLGTAWAWALCMGMCIGTGSGTGTGMGHRRHGARARAQAWARGVPSQYLAQDPPYLSRMPQPTVYCSVGGWKYLVRGRAGVFLGGVVRGWDKGGVIMGCCAGRYKRELAGCQAMWGV